jgi:hypothetical protein
MVGATELCLAATAGLGLCLHPEGIWFSPAVATTLS